MCLKSKHLGPWMGVEGGGGGGVLRGFLVILRAASRFAQWVGGG